MRWRLAAVRQWETAAGTRENTNQRVEVANDSTDELEQNPRTSELMLYAITRFGFEVATRECRSAARRKGDGFGKGLT